MKKNFIVGQSNEIITEGKIYDLHNSYNYVGIVLNGRNCQLQILFEPSPEVGKGNFPILLNFEGIDYMEFSPKFGTHAVYGLDEMGYKSPTDHDDNWLMDEQQASSEDHLFFRLDGGCFIRVHSQDADFIEASNGD